MSKELVIKSGEKIQPLLSNKVKSFRHRCLLSVVVMTEEGNIPAYFAISSASAKEEREGIVCLYGASDPETLFLGRFSRKIIEYGIHPVRYELHDYYSFLLQRVCLRVRLPGVQEELLAYPLKDVLTRGEARFDLFGPASFGLPLLDAKIRRATKAELPTLVAPPGNWKLTDQEKGKGLLFIPDDSEFQKQIEISFTLQKPEEVSEAEYNFHLPGHQKIKIGDEEKAEGDLANLLESIPTIALQALYREFSEKVANSLVGRVEINRLPKPSFWGGSSYDAADFLRGNIALYEEYLKGIERETRRRIEVDKKDNL